MGLGIFPLAFPRSRFYSPVARALATVDMMFVFAGCKSSVGRRVSRSYTCFGDLQKTYDSFDRSLLWVVLARFGVPPVMVDMMCQFHDGM